MKALLGTLLRIALKIGGGYLAAKGIDAGDAGDAVTGIATAAAGGILSLVNHVRNRKSTAVKINRPS